VRRPTAVTGLWVAVNLLSIAALAALVRWSRWWPHPDMRQIWATGAAWVAGVVGLAAFVAAFLRLDRAGRARLVGAAAIAAVIGWSGGFSLLVTWTAAAR
jgi:hypothetical protein